MCIILLIDQYARAWINWVDRRSQLIQFANRKVVLVIFMKEQKVSYGTVRYAFDVTYYIYI